MMRWALILLAAAAIAGDAPKKPDYMKRKAETPAEADAPVVTEMKVERSSSGNAVSSGKPETKKQSPVHGEIRGVGTQFGKQGSGTAVIQDKKNGKWAVTAGGEKTKVQ